MRFFLLVPWPLLLKSLCECESAHATRNVRHETLEGMQAQPVVSIREHGFNICRCALIFELFYLFVFNPSLANSSVLMMMLPPRYGLRKQRRMCLSRLRMCKDLDFLHILKPDAPARHRNCDKGTLYTLTGYTHRSRTCSRR